MKRRVLVVDDNSDVRELLLHILMAQGHQALGADGALSALSILEREDVDLILLDVMMPGISGIDLLARIRSSQSRYQNIPIAMITALSAEDEINKALNSGANTYLVKPFRSADIKELMEAI